jgi:O-methyltransferase involved in polyketide biosynthesis
MALADDDKGARVAWERIELKGDEETLPMTLYLRALDNRAAAPILGDEYADELLSRLLQYTLRRHQ